MVHAVDDRLRDEARRYGLVFGCRRCEHFQADGARCSLGFPVEPHLDVDLEAADEIAFCKAFELG